jgi:membrane associated rhomboid family serine protease
MLFPIGDDNSSRRTLPVVTYALIALNVLVFFIELNQGVPFIRKWAVVPHQLVTNPSAEIPTIFTSMFMHAGWAHLLGNMLFLWIFGDNVEERLGRARFLIFYLACGVAAALAQVAVSAESSIPNLGASGAISGVLAGYLVLIPKGRVRVLMGARVVSLPALVVIGIWILLQLISGVSSFTQPGQTGGIAYMAHIGGFVAGLALAFFLSGKSPRIAAWR